MNLVSRLQTHYGWTPNFHLDLKKHVPQGRNEWIVLAQEGCFLVTPKESKKLSIVLDQRLFGDTIFKVEQTSRDTYNILDVWMYNSSCIYAGTTFKQRSNWLVQIINTFHKHIAGLTKLTHIQLNTITVQKSKIPDVYHVKDHDGYIRIPDLKTSRFMRSKGDEFELCCVKEDDYWIIQENIPDI
jgi:hypothetical protein